MKDVIAKLRAFLRDEDGLTMVEYAVAGALIVGVAVLAFQTLGKNVADRITAIAKCIATPSTCTQ